LDYLAGHFNVWCSKFEEEEKISISFTLKYDLKRISQNKRQGSLKATRES